MKYCVIFGTRPEIVKLSPIIKELGKRKLDYFLLHTGQHYNYELDGIFIKELELPKPKYNLNVGSYSASKQTAKMMLGLESVLSQEKPDAILVLGDTNSVFAGAFVGNKLNIKVGHIEAGLRSYDRNMPEEINRILVDHMADYLFAPTNNACDTLWGEGIPVKRTFMTGNTIVDAIKQNIKNNRKLDIEREYFLATIHRQENVDNQARLQSIMESLVMVNEKYKKPVILPIHPHTEQRIKNYNISTNGIIIVDPVGYLEFLHLEYDAKAILTDSGGVQEEACILGIPCVTLRDNTERPETVDVGANMLAGVETDRVLECLDIMLNNKRKWANPFGDGNSASRILDIIEDI